MDKPRPPRRALIVHAGAWDIPPEAREAHRLGSRAAVESGWDVLVAGGSALQAVRAAIRSMENDRNLNAGAGSVLTRDGFVEHDAGVMCGTLVDAGGVAGIRDRPNPIEAAAAVLDSPYVLLVGDGAARYLDERQVPRCDPETLIEQRERDRLQAVLTRAAREGREFIDPGARTPGGTVGAVAIDRYGRIAAASSSGGICGKPPGRIGDTAVPGAGYFADNLTAGASCSGWGEPLLRMGMARRAADLARDHNAMDATWLALQELENRFDGYGGIILISRDGSIGYAYNTPSMAVAYMDGELECPFIGGVQGDPYGGGEPGEEED